jgi:hypothetical protein
MVPGAKRPWSMESEDESHPLEDEGVRAGDGGAGRVAACDAAVTSPRVACPETTGAAPGLAGFPHDGQKRAVPWIVAPQAGQNIEGILRHGEDVEDGEDGRARESPPHPSHLPHPPSR